MAAPDSRNQENPMRNALLIVGLLALAIGLLWIGQGTGTIGYGAALAALGLILIWQSKR
jgi:uncharacterized membrane protein